MIKPTIASFILLLLLHLELPIFAQEKETPLPPEQILEKHILAIGGKEKFEAIKTRVGIGSIKSTGLGEIKFLLISERPDKLTVLYKMSSYDWRLTYTSREFFSTPLRVLANNVLLTGKSDKLENKFKEMYSSGLLFGDMSLYNILLNSPSVMKMKSVKTKKLNDRATHVIEVKQGKADVGKLYFDTESFMLVRIDYGSVELDDTRIILDNSPGKGQTIDFYQEFSDFREIDGIKLPFRLRHVIIPPISANQRASTVDVEIIEYKHNLKIDPKLFSYN